MSLTSLVSPLISILERPLGFWLARYGGRVPSRSRETLEPHFDGTGWDADQGFGSLARHWSVVGDVKGTGEFVSPAVSLGNGLSLTHASDLSRRCEGFHLRC